MSNVRTLSALVICSVSYFSCAVPVFAQEVPWRLDYNAARKEAREKNKPIVLDFGTNDCFWCKKLDMTTFRDPAVVKALTDQFIPVKINADKDMTLAQALGINSYPTLVFAAPNGKILNQQDGYVDVAQFSQLLQRYQTEAARPAVGAETSVQSSDRFRSARDLLALVKEEYKTQNDAECLDHCKALSTRYADQPEAAEGERVAAQIRNNPERLAQACDKLSDTLSNTYLELAESLVRKGQGSQAVSCLEKVLRTFPGTHAAQVAQERMYQLKDVARQSESKAVIRSQMP
jgi:thioredoxin-like negative regulator of GroEL